jgi:phage/plasmid-associated DNA primase
MTFENKIKFCHYGIDDDFKKDGKKKLSFIEKCENTCKDGFDFHYKKEKKYKKLKEDNGAFAQGYVSEYITILGIVKVDDIREFVCIAKHGLQLYCSILEKTDVEYQINEYIDCNQPFKFHIDIDPPKTKGENYDMFQHVPLLIQSLEKILNKKIEKYYVRGADDYKKKFHLVVPDIVCANGYTYTHLMRLLSEELKQHLDFDCIEDPRWESYEKYHEYPQICLRTTFSQKYDKKTNSISRKSKIQYASYEIEYYNDLFLTVYDGVFPESVNDKIPNLVEYKREQPVMKNVPEDNFSVEQQSERSELMTQRLNLIKPERFICQAEWFKLLCLMRQNNLPLELFLTLSEDSGYRYYNEETCKTAWYKLDTNYRNKYGFPLIHRWLDEDEIDWKKIPNKNLGNLIVNECTHNNLSKIYAEHSKDEVFYTSAYGWIVFDNRTKIWTYNNTEKSLTYPISSFFSATMKEHIGSIKKPTKEDASEEKKYIEKLKKAYAVRDKVGMSSFTKGIIDQLEHQLTKDNSFIDKFDSNPNLFAFSDGVCIDLNAKGAKREIQKEDFIMTTTGYPFPEKNEEFIEKMNGIIKSLSDDPEQIKSILSLLALPLWGENKNEIFAQLTGTGRNGKGLLDTGISQVYGNYYQSIDSSQLTEYSKDKQRANSELASCRFARVVMASEPEDSNANGKSNTLKTSTVKKWTGRDKITTRFLNKDTFTFNAKFCLMMQLNDLMDLSVNDDAIKSRMKIIELPFKFVKKEDGKELKPHERPIDVSLKDLVKTSDYRNAFFWILLKVWLDNKGQFYESEKVKNYTSEFFETQNPVESWFNEFYEKDTERSMFATELFAKFKQDNFDSTLNSVGFGRLLKDCCNSKRSNKGVIYFCKDKIINTLPLSQEEYFKIWENNQPK